MPRLHPLFLALAVCGLAAAPAAIADSAYQALPFSQDWTNTALINASDDWSGVSGIVGHRGDDLTTATGTDPQGILADGTATPIDVNANQSNPSTYTTGGVAEFHLPDPTVALNGSGTADAPFLLIHLDTRGFQAIRVRYLLRDLDGSADNAVQAVALQYRIGDAGNFTNVPAAFVADATAGGTATLATPVDVILPTMADDQPRLQLRIITTNAAGNDEWVGVDDISVTGTPAGAINQPIAATCPSFSVDRDAGGSAPVTASDPDSRVTGIALAGAAPAGISLGPVTAATMDGGMASAALLVTAGTAAGTYALPLAFGNDEAQAAECTASVTVTGVTPIAAIQGAGAASPLLGQTVTTRGVVTLVVPTNYGFFLQDPVGDGDPATPEGLFVYSPAGLPAGIAAGNRVRVTGTVAEFNGLTELTGPTGVAVEATGQTIAPVPVPFPEAVEGDLKRYEGMLVQVPGSLTVSQNYFQGRYGEVTLAAGGRLEKPTNRFRPGTPEAIAMTEDNARRRITIDDGSNDQNPNPIPYLGSDGTLRAGDRIEGLTGVLFHGAVSDSLRDTKLHPTLPPVIVRENARPGAPAVAGTLKVASFNVLNYFTTLDQAGAACFPSGTRADCRGADSAAEFDRQKAKIVAALRQLDADVVGLMEIENRGNDAVLDLVDGLNAAYGWPAYAAVPLPAAGTGGDAIRVAMIYKPGRVSPAGTPLADADPVHNRPPLAQAFATPGGERFSVVVNHFKSKGSCPTAGDPDADAGDGQGCWNPRRMAQAGALLGFVTAVQATSGDPDVLVIGDLNAYGKEDPVAALTGAGLVDLAARYAGLPYSYVFDGESGALDHLLATPSLALQAVGAGHWHVNADEPSVIDYNTEFKTQDLYGPHPYRSSDHDPAVAGFELRRVMEGGSGRDMLNGTAADEIIAGGPGADVLAGGAGRDVFVYRALDEGLDTLRDFTPGQDRIDVTAITACPDGDRAVLRFAPGNSGALLQIDPDGAGPAGWVSLAALRGLSPAALSVARDVVRGPVACR